MLEQGGSMANPWEYREVLAAAVKYDPDRTPEQVIAAHKRRHDEQMMQARAERRGRGQKAPEAPPATTTDYSAIPKNALAELDRLRNAAAQTE